MKQHFIFAVLVLVVLTSPTLGFSFSIDDITKVVKNWFNFNESGINLAQEFANYEKKEVHDSTPTNGQEYDYIIVGAGTAGATLAARLSEIQQASVLLIEAGGHENLLTDVPLLAMYLQLDKKINWNYATEPSNDYCLANNNKQCRIPKGKILGGSSVLNFMIATRGTKSDYDEWAQLTGDQSWSYQGMLQYFKKLENHNVKVVDVDRSYHGSNGPVNIVDPYISPLGKAFVEAGKEMGFPPGDYNGAKVTGFNNIQTNQIRGERLSTNRAYLHPIKNRKNLSVSINSHVNKILIDPVTKTAYGVDFTKAGKNIQVVARKEVILSAGSIASPQILMLSGIGPAEHLRSLGINVLVDSPVGENLMDHVAYGGLTFAVNETVGIVVPKFFIPTDPMIGKYLTQRTGELATPGGAEGVGFVNVDDPSPNNVDPNIEFIFSSASIISSYTIFQPLDLKPEFYNKYVADKVYRYSWTLWPVLQKPKSRGKVLLRSKNPGAHPRIIPNYFSDPEDVRLMIKAIRMGIKVGKTQAMKRYGSKLYKRPIPGCEQHKWNSDAYWECAFRTFTFTFWHQTGTCKMGHENDPTAVVNSQLQVKAIHRLRVVDASIMPNIPTAHLNIPTIAIAEKAADMIKSVYQYM